MQGRLIPSRLVGYMTDSKSTSGGLLCIFGDHTCCANDMGMQGTDSTTEAEVTSLITGQMMEGWSTVIDLLDSSCQSSTERPFASTHTQNIDARQESSDRATPNMTCASHLAASVFSQTRSINLQWQSRSYNPSYARNFKFRRRPDG